MEHKVSIVTPWLVQLQWTSPSAFVESNNFYHVYLNNDLIAIETATQICKWLQSHHRFAGFSELKLTLKIQIWKSGKYPEWINSADSDLEVRVDASWTRLHSHSSLPATSLPDLEGLN